MHPVLFTAGPITVYTYGLFVALGLAAALVMVLRRADRAALPRAMALDLLFLFFVAGVAGSRLFYVLQHAEDYAADPARIFALREGGLVWYGGFITAASTGLIYARVHRWPILRLCDFFAPVVAVAHALGRLGCFFNGCCYGRITGGGWGLVFPGDTFRRHPVQLYEAAALLVLAVALEWTLRRRPRREGVLFIAYLAAYGVLRFLLEFLRADQVPVAGLTPPQWTSLLLIAGAAALGARLRHGGRPRT